MPLTHPLVTAELRRGNFRHEGLSIVSCAGEPTCFPNAWPVALGPNRFLDRVQWLYTNLINNTYEKRYHVYNSKFYIIHLKHLWYYCQTNISTYNYIMNHNIDPDISNLMSCVWLGKYCPVHGLPFQFHVDPPHLAVPQQPIFPLRLQWMSQPPWMRRGTHVQS